MNHGPARLARVARSEDELIKLARGLVTGARALPRARARAAIETIGPTAMALLEQTLARGLSAWLLRSGGWQTRRTWVAADGRAVRGRLWDRHRELPPLRFGPASFALLTWLHGEDLVRPTRALERQPDTTLADDLLHYLALGQLVRAGLDFGQPAFTRSPLSQLGYADALGEVLAGTGPDGEPERLPPVDFRPLTTGPGAIIMEALQPQLAERWLAMERRKGTIASLDQMLRIGRAQDQVLRLWFAAIDGAGQGQPRRRDLAGFVAEAARELLARGPERLCPDHRWWIRSLDARAPLSARQAAFTAAAAFLRGISRLGLWLDEAGVVAHFDEDYELAQLWLSSWQQLRARPDPDPAPDPPAAMPASILDRANFLTRSLESLHSLGVAEPPAPNSRELP